MLAVGIGAIGYWKFRSCTGTAFFLWGAGAWMASIAVKAIAALASPGVEGFAARLFPAFPGPLVWLYTGLLTGISECGTTLFFARAVKKLREANWSEAIAFGVGFGATEAVCVAGLSLTLMGLSVTLPEIRAELPPEYQILASPTSVADYLAPALERLAAVVLHTFSGALVIYAVRNAAWRWLWLAFVYKTAVDALPVELIAGRRPLLLLLPYLPFVILGIVGCRALEKRWTPA